MDDNARPHRARLVVNFLRQAGVTTMGWPSASPDLNPIENFPDMLERHVNENHPPPQTLQQLFGFLQVEWGHPSGRPEKAGGVHETSLY